MTGTGYLKQESLEGSGCPSDAQNTALHWAPVSCVGREIHISICLGLGKEELKELLRASQRDNVLLNNLTQGANAVLGAVRGKVIGRLEVQPELRTRFEGLPKQPSCFRGHSALSTNQFIDSLGRHFDVARQANLRDAQGLQELG